MAEIWVVGVQGQNNFSLLGNAQAPSNAPTNVIDYVFEFVGRKALKHVGKNDNFKVFYFNIEKQRIHATTQPSLCISGQNRYAYKEVGRKFQVEI